MCNSQPVGLGRYRHRKQSKLRLSQPNCRQGLAVWSGGGGLNCVTRFRGPALFDRHQLWQDLKTQGVSGIYIALVTVKRIVATTAATAKSGILMVSPQSMRRGFQRNSLSSTRNGILTTYFLVKIRSATTANAMTVMSTLARPMSNLRFGLPSNRGLPSGGDQKCPGWLPFQRVGCTMIAK